ncbi:hypothetical protein, partial, partial [Parasitella parasitica]
MVCAKVIKPNTNLSPKPQEYHLCIRLAKQTASGIIFTIVSSSLPRWGWLITTGNTASGLTIRPLFKHHMRLITPTPMPPELSFFVPEWRSHPLNHPTSIVLACYKAFDHFGIKFDFSGCS